MKKRQPQINYIKVSKKLSWALRHGIVELGLTINAAGYVNLQELLSKREFSSVTPEIIETLVANDEKTRFSLLKEHGVVFIRANQGHTISQVKDEELLTPILNPNDYQIVVHGTNKLSWKTIKYRGLYKMQRNHIHFARGLPGDNQVISGARVNCEVFIFIDLSLAISDGMKFYISENQVILSSGFGGFISPKYFSKVLINKNVMPIDYKPIDFDYFLILDFEANCIENGTLPCQEIIEFPVKVLNAQTLNVEYIFHSYVQPEVVPSITDFCTNLTGITQDMVNNQYKFPEVLQNFHNFLVTNNILQSRWIFVTCGDWDLKTCLRNEAQYKKLPINNYFNAWINIKFLIPKFKGGMMELLSLFSIPHSGKHHSGIDDVTNITECLKYLLHNRIGICFEDIRMNAAQMVADDVPFRHNKVF